jgi:DNA-binding CsgD family transcriptional regulator
LLEVAAVTLSDREWASLVRARYAEPTDGGASARSDDSVTRVKRALIERALSVFPFTPTELDIAIRLLMSESIASIRQSQGCEEFTIKTHLGHIYIKARVDGSADLKSEVLKRVLDIAAPYLTHLR